MRNRLLLLLGLVLLPVAGRAQNVTIDARVETRVMVRAVSQDAKVLHDGVDGARITVRDVATGRVLAEGLQRGTSGDTDRIMRTPRVRGAVVYGTEGTAGFLARVPLARPTVVEIVAEGPLSAPQATMRAATTMLLVPGRHVEGEGVLLTLHGFIVAAEAPTAAVAAGEALPVRATVTMSCGCPTSPGGLWNSDDYEIVARLLDGDERELSRAPLAYAGAASTYAATLPVPAGLSAGRYTLEVLALDPESANFGHHRLPVEVR